MKNIVFLMLAMLVLATGCQEKSKKNGATKQRKILKSSAGRINALSVVMKEDLWKGKIGEALREAMAAPVLGLPQQEPLFTLSQMPPESFSGFPKTSRLFIKVQPHNGPLFKIVTDTFARPQTGVFIGGNQDTTIIGLIERNADRIVEALKQTEIRENQRRIAKSLGSTAILKDKFGIAMSFPSVYRYAKEKDHFVWLRREIPHGSMEILVYEVPLKVIDQGSNVVKNIVQMRDSIGKKFIPGETEGSYMITEKAYAPYLIKTEIDGKFAYLTKGTWTVKGAYMAGPFVNYAIRDEKHNRYLVLDGFVFKPGSSKRNSVFELKAIFKSVNFEN